MKCHLIRVTLFAYQELKLILIFEPLIYIMNYPTVLNQMEECMIGIEMVTGSHSFHIREHVKVFGRPLGCSYCTRMSVICMNVATCKNICIP